MGSVSPLRRSSELFAGEEFEAHDLRLAEVARDQRNDPRRYTTGIENVDASTEMIRPGDMVVVGAREGQGKTSFFERFALANSLERKILFASLDMKTNLVHDRCLAKLMRVQLSDVQEAFQRRDDDYFEALEQLRERDLLAYEPKAKRDRTIQAITKRAESVSAEILCIDYTRLIEGWDYGKKAADIVDYVTEWAHETSITTILLTQLRDEAVNRRPHNGHIQDTAQLAQRADRVILLYRPYLMRGRGDNICEVITTKNRGGPTSVNHVGWVGATMDFFAFDGEQEASARCCTNRG